MASAEPSVAWEMGDRLRGLLPHMPGEALKQRLPALARRLGIGPGRLRSIYHRDAVVRADEADRIRALDAELHAYTALRNRALVDVSPALARLLPPALAVSASAAPGPADLTHPVWGLDAHG